MEKLSKEFLSTLQKYSNILLYIKGSPDPDAIASAYAIKMICDKFNINSLIVATLPVSLPQNKALIKKLNIPIEFDLTKVNISKFDSYIVMDYQSAYIEGVTNVIPCAMHLDHHEKVDEKIEIDFKYICNDIGAVSTMIALFLKDLNLDIDLNILTKISTSLLYGIQVDTDKYAHATPKDYEALNYLSKYSDTDILKEISDTPLSAITIKLLWDAMENQILYKDWLITGIGFIDEHNRDSIAIIADFLLKREETSIVIVFAAINISDDKLILDASLRTLNDKINLNDIIKGITSEGGARKFKGAYQINLDYFISCPDKKLLWDLLYTTTVEVFKKSRDNLNLIELKSFYKKIKDKFFQWNKN